MLAMFCYEWRANDSFLSKLKDEKKNANEQEGTLATNTVGYLLEIGKFKILIYQSIFCAKKGNIPIAENKNNI